MATKKEREEQESIAKSQVETIKEENLSLANRLRLMLQIRQARKEEVNLQKELKELGRKGVIEANKYSKVTEEIKKLEKELVDAKKTGHKSTIKFTKDALDAEKKKQADLKRTAGGALKAMQDEAKKKKDSLSTEKKLIADINAERAKGNKLGRVGVAITDLFRSKEAKQRQVDIARAKAGGGINIPPTAGGPGGGAGGAGGAGGGKGGGKAALGAAGVLGGLGIVGLIIAGIKAGIEKLKAPFVALGNLAKSNLTAPLSQVSNLVSGGIGGGYGVGGGAVSGGGATSILGGFQDIASKIPLIGGLLGGLIGIFKGVVDLVLGIDQGITNFARNLGISKDQAKAIKEEFRAVAKASGSIVVNETRLMESQAELTKALGVRNRFSNEALQTNIELKELAGLELETRKALLQTSIIQSKNADDLTKSVLAQSKAFEFQTGIAFEYRQILGEASKQAGVLGLTFTKYPEKLTKALMTTKAMGIELKQLDSMASSFLDFESSITKEFEAQVLTGKELNLTKAREAALNNDLVTLAQEITRQVGNSEQYLKMNRIQQEAIAEAVGMTRDGLADALKQQEYYRRLGATNLKQAQEELRVLKEKGHTEKEINKMIGEDAYNYITQTSTAERLAELMNKIKTIFIEFVEKSGILDFITKPEKIQDLAKTMIDYLAGAVNMIGNIIASILNGIGTIAGFFDSETGDELKALASQVRGGSASFAGGLRGVAGSLSGTLAPSIGTAVEAGAKTEGQPGAVYGPVPAAKPGENTIVVYTVIDGEVVAKTVKVNAPNMYGFK